MDITNSTHTFIQRFSAVGRCVDVGVVVLVVHCDSLYYVSVNVVLSFKRFPCFYQFKHGPEAVSTYISATNIVVVVVKLNQRTRHVISLTFLNALAVTVARSKTYGERRRSCILRHFAIVT